MDRKSRLQFFVNTGDEMSIIYTCLWTWAEKLSGYFWPPRSQLFPNSDLLDPLADVTLYFGWRRTFWWVFMVAIVDNRILRADFFRRYILMVDVGHKLLMDTRTIFFVHGIIFQSSSPSPLLVTAGQWLHSLLARVPYYHPAVQGGSRN